MAPEKTGWDDSGSQNDASKKLHEVNTQKKTSDKEKGSDCGC